MPCDSPAVHTKVWKLLYRMVKTNKSESGEPTVQSLIEAAGKTQRELAANLSVTELSINNWANGRKLPRVDHFLALCKELSVSPKTLARAMRLDTSGIPDDER